MYSSRATDYPFGLSKKRPDQANGGARHGKELPGRDHSVTDGGRHHPGIRGAPTIGVITLGL